MLSESECVGGGRAKKDQETKERREVIGIEAIPLSRFDLIDAKANQCHHHAQPSCTTYQDL